MKNATRELIEREIQKLARHALEYEDSMNEAKSTAEGYRLQRDKTLLEIEQLKADLDAG